MASTQKHSKKVKRSHSRTVPRPQQQPSSLKIKRGSDFRAQRMIKCPELCHFHSLAEYFYAALLEGDASVERYVPQPFRLHFGRKVYIPDIYWLRDGQPYVGELKAGGKMDVELQRAAVEYFAGAGISFEVIDNEAVYAQAMPAQNWMSIVRWLLTYPDMDADEARSDVLQWLFESGEITYGEVADLGHRASRLAHECAVHRMLLSGELSADFDQQFFGMDTRLWLS